MKNFMALGVARTLPLLNRSRVTVKTDSVPTTACRPTPGYMGVEDAGQAAKEESLKAGVGQDQRRRRLLLERVDEGQDEAAQGADDHQQLTRAPC